MEVYYAILFLILGLMFGSFYNVVGYRLPKKESIMFPSSHCTACGHKLRPFELIPVLSFIFLGRKCRGCKTKISWYYSFFELLTGLLFMFSYLKFGFSIELAAALIFTSIIVIITVSDYKYYIIPDEIIVIGIITLSITYFLNGGFIDGSFNLGSAGIELGIVLLNGLLAFFLMWGIKLIGDKIFKKESMGGGDIKLLFIFGMVLGFPLAIVSIFLSSIIALPISIIILKKSKSSIIPFGPFLSAAALILFFTNVHWLDVLTIFS